MLLFLAGLCHGADLAASIRALRELSPERYIERGELLAGLPRGPISRALVEATPDGLRALPDDVDPDTVVSRLAAAGMPVNPYLEALDVLPPAQRYVLRAVQPAVVRIFSGGYGGTGVNLDPSGRVLTNAHVVTDEPLVVEFPDGSRYAATVERRDTVRDLALLRLAGGVALPHAVLAPAPPELGAAIVIIGHPGRRSTPPFVVITGHIDGFRTPRDGPQATGATRHDAPTADGHSGSPLFDGAGCVVALHNSFDPRNGARHAVSWEAITAFLRAEAGE